MSQRAICPVLNKGLCSEQNVLPHQAAPHPDNLEDIHSRVAGSGCHLGTRGLFESTHNGFMGPQSPEIVYRTTGMLTDCTRERVSSDC